MPRRLLNRDLIVREAADLADERGIEHLTLSAVAKQLDVPVPNLYNHIGGLDSLHEAVAELGHRQLREALTAAAIGRAGRDALFALADAYRAFALAHPGRYMAINRAAPHKNEALMAGGVELRKIYASALAGYGLNDDDIIDVVRAIRAVLHGFASLEANQSYVLDRSRDVSFHRLIDALHLAIVRWNAPLDA